MSSGDVPLFLYGTLKRGHRRHDLLGGSVLVQPQVHAPGYTLVDAGGYPGMIQAPSAAHFVEGEVFLVGPETLAVLDNYEDLASGEYRRATVCVLDARGVPLRVHAYLYQWASDALPAIGSRWAIEHESSPPPARHP